ncbi:Uncharacterised protein [Serratia quinivorans]|uniref:hypothetical protein n=1 Tax=Serratia quinivorans TaxID=137545 RepID=UPI00217A5698|nr:hypothetical protein [Serratia quinivorans]CAI1528700.1 Uncharacterised protein [Serratia quinivorans]
MNITLDFKKMSLTNGSEITLSIAPSAMQKMIIELLANGYLTTEDLVTYIIGQLQVCDQVSLSHVLPEAIINRLITTYESVKNGEDNV